MAKDAANERSDQRASLHPLSRARLLPVWRLVAGWMLAVLGVPLLAIGLLSVRRSLELSSVLLLFLTLVIAIAALGGTWPSVAAAAGSFLLLNWFYTPPFHTLAIRDPQNALALVVFIAVALVVGALVSLAARRTRQAARARFEADVISKTGIALLGGHEPVTDLLTLIRSTFSLDAAAVLRQSSSGWRVGAHAGTPCPTSPDQADRSIPIGDGAYLSLTGEVRRIDSRILDAFVAQIGSALRHEELRAEASAARSAAEANELRTALLAAVSHDLRTPLSSIKAAVTSLLQDEVAWSPEATREFLETIDTQTDRLDGLVGNLLDMSRLRAGSLRPTMRDVAIDEVVGVSLAALGDRARSISVEVPESLPVVRADHALLERSLANLLDNALVHAAGSAVSVRGTRSDGTLRISVIDRGPGIPSAERGRAFEPFQRLGDDGHRSGVGLGLAVARGFVDAMGGRLLLEDTPGGGLTAHIALPVAEP